VAGSYSGGGRGGARSRLARAARRASGARQSPAGGRTVARGLN
jgi:hypothetical protein